MFKFDGVYCSKKRVVHVGVMTGKRFPHFWPFVREMQWWLVEGRGGGGVVIPSFEVSFDVSVNKLLNNQSSCRWLETSWRYYYTRHDRHRARKRRKILWNLKIIRMDQDMSTPCYAWLHREITLLISNFVSRDCKSMVSQRPITFAGNARFTLDI